MHELGIVERIVEAVTARALAAGSGRVTEVELELGEDSGVDRESVELHWPIVSRGTVADGAGLRIVAAAEPRALRVTAIEVDETD